MLTPRPARVHTTPWWQQAWLWLAVAIIGLVWFGWWLLTAVTPVLVVEAKYAYRKTLQDTFKVGSLAELFIPNFSGLTFRGKTKYEEFGIVIPALFLDEPVVFNVDPNDEKAYTAALKKGIAHASGTGFPDNPGIGYYFAHSSNPALRSQYNAVFYLLGKLKPSDDIFIWQHGQQYKYQVTDTLITTPEDVSFLNTAYDQETIVLQTCWPPGTTQKRLLVFAERVIEAE